MNNLVVKPIPENYVNPQGIKINDKFGIYENGRLILTGTELYLNSVLAEVFNKGDKS